MDSETLRQLASLGVGGVLAGAIFIAYRKDARQWQEEWKGQSQMLMQVVKEVTAAVTSLREMLERERDEDDRRRRR